MNCSRQASASHFRLNLSHTHVLGERSLVVLFRNIIEVAVIALLLSGCTTAPGSNVSSHGLFSSSHKNTKNNQLEAARILITPELVKSLAQDKTALSNASESVLTSDQYVYRIRPGDQLSVVVWDHPELTAPFGSFNNIREQGNVVREDGTIYYPFIGAVKAENRTALEIRAEMEARLSEFIERPQIDVRVAGYRSQRYFVAGSVRQPGSFPVTDVPMTVVDAIN